MLDGSSTLTLSAASLQQLTRLFEQYLLSRSQQHGFLALPSHPADTASLLQLQFLFDVLQKTISLKVSQDPQSLVRHSLWCVYFHRSYCILSHHSKKVVCIFIFLTQLINPPGDRLQSVVKIFPFKSLKGLEVNPVFIFFT